MAAMCRQTAQDNVQIQVPAAVYDVPQVAMMEDSADTQFAALFAILK